MVSNEWLYMWPDHYKFYFRGVTHEWISYVFEFFFLFWFVVIYLLSSWDEMDVPAKLIPDDTWAAEDDKTGFLNVGMYSFGILYL